MLTPLLNLDGAVEFCHSLVFGCHASRWREHVKRETFDIKKVKHGHGERGRGTLSLGSLIPAQSSMPRTALDWRNVAGPV